jgi:hypothetical protein
LRLHGLLQKEQIEKLKQMMPDCSIIQNGKLPDGNQKVRGRFKDLNFDQHLNMEHGNGAEKQNRYQQLLISMIKEQWNWILDNSVVRVIDDHNAVDSLRMAETAKNTAKQF